MFRFELAQLVRRGVEDLSQDVEYLESMLSAVRDARQRLRDLDMDLSWDGLVDGGEPAGLSASARAAPSAGSVTGASGSPAGKSADYPDSRERFAAALHDAGADRPTDLVDVAKLWASFHGGVLRTRDVAAAMILMDLSSSTMENLPGYIARKARNSGEFERVGKSGGLYRWLRYREPVDAASDQAMTERLISSESPGEGETPGEVVSLGGGDVSSPDFSMSLGDEHVALEVKGGSFA